MVKRSNERTAYAWKQLEELARLEFRNPVTLKAVGKLTSMKS